MENLISMTDFVLQIETKQCKSDDKEENLDLIFNYATFLKQPLELWMFVPCDEDSNVLEKRAPLIGMYDLKTIKYQEAKDRCLFDYVTVIFNNNIYLDVKLENGNVFRYVKKEKRFMYAQDYKIENLLGRNITLTETAKNMFKQFL